MMCFLLVDVIRLDCEPLPVIIASSPKDVLLALKVELLKRELMFPFLCDVILCAGDVVELNVELPAVDVRLVGEPPLVWLEDEPHLVWLTGEPLLDWLEDEPQLVDLDRLVVEPQLVGLDWLVVEPWFPFLVRLEGEPLVSFS